MAAMPSEAPSLRPLTVGEILDASFKVYRRSFATMAKAVLVVAVPFGILLALVRSSASDTTQTALRNVTNPQTGVEQVQVNSHALETVLGLSSLELLITLFATAVATAVIYRVVGGVYLGSTSTWKEAVRGGLRRANSVLWVTIVTTIIFALIIAVPTVLVLTMVSSHLNGLGALFGVLTGIPAFVGLIWFTVVAQLSVPTVMLENYRGLKAIRRAAKLTHHLWWRCLGCILLVSLIVGLVGLVVSGILVAALLTVAKSHVAVIGVDFVANLVTTVFFTPITACALVVLSIDLRVRKEGYDLELLANSLGIQPGSGALSFLPRAPQMWGGPGGGWPQQPGPWGTPGPHNWPPPQTPHGWVPPPGQQSWPPPPAQQSWPPPHSPQGQWSQPYAPGWGPQPGGTPTQTPPATGWIPPGQPAPSDPPPLPYAPSPPEPAPQPYMPPPMPTPEAEHRDPQEGPTGNDGS
jgi:hypothetical protein